MLVTNAVPNATLNTTSNATPGALTVAVVSYNVRDLLRRCLDSVYRGFAEMDLAPHVIVVDNASVDGSAAMVREAFPGVEVIANATNAGFGAACNQALARAGEIIVFLNPDAELTPGALPVLRHVLDTHPDVALAGPRLTFPDGTAQPSRRRFPSLAALALESTPAGWRWPSLAPLRRYYCAGEPDGIAGPVDWLSGACLAGRTAALRDVGGFAPAFFMYFEEVDLSRRLHADGWRTWYAPPATVIHHHSGSAGQNVGRRDRHYYASKYIYTARYFGWTAARALRLWSAAQFAAESAVQLARRDGQTARRYASLARWLWQGKD